jgi:hypothetical protein
MSTAGYRVRLTRRVLLASGTWRTEAYGVAVVDTATERVDE